MNAPLAQHQIEIERNKLAWADKPLLRELYAGFYRKIVAQIDPAASGLMVEIGGGIGNLKAYKPECISTDLFPNPWLDLACDAYALPFHSASISNLILSDVFHHLEAPFAFLREAGRVLAPGGRVILFEPYISMASYPIYGLLHPEPVALRGTINRALEKPPASGYYAAQGNATRLFFADEPLPGFVVRHREAFSAFAYLLSGGFSKPSFYPHGALPHLCSLDRALSRFPSLFGGRCLVVLEASA